uniref:Uncharacterized protein n=1 Tax=Arundo donax TaxID=35708 RepID=A0A0A9H5B1_ARUDO
MIPLSNSACSSFLASSNSTWQMRNMDLHEVLE